MIAGASDCLSRRLLVIRPVKNLARYIKPAGRIAVIDFYPELGGHKNEPALQITKEQTAAWMNAIGFKSVEEFALFNDKWFVLYSR